MLYLLRYKQNENPHGVPRKEQNKLRINLRQTISNSKFY